MTDIEKIKLGKRIKELRTENGLTQKVLAQEIGIARNTLASYENGTYTMSVDVLIKLAKTLDVTTDYILGLSEYYK